MPAITIADLNNAKLDVDHIAEIATSPDLTATDRLGNSKKTMAGAIATISAIANRGAWATGTAYSAKDTVQESGTWHICVTPHTSGATFAGDAANWRVYQGVTADEMAAPDGASKVGNGDRTVEEALEAINGKLGATINLANFGAIGDGVTDDTAAVQAAIDAAIACGVQEIEAGEGSYNIAGALTNRSNVTFVGSGQLIGTGAYRTRVVPGQADGPAPFANIVPQAHLRKFLAVANPVVVVVGDSIFTPQPNTLDQSNTPWALLIDKIQRDNPGKAIAFYNRAVGGMTWAEINGTAWTNFPDWYVDTGRAWLEYVKDLNPDLVIFASGMNDAHLGGFDPTNVTSVVAKVKAWAKVPDMLFVTTPVPTLEPGPGLEMYGTKSDQEGRDKNAGWIRAYADYNGYGYLDVNRQFNMARDSRDILNTQAEQVAADVSLPTGSYVVPAEFECRDFSMRVAMPASAFAGPNTLAVTVGPTTIDVVHFYASAGKIKCDLYYFTGTLAVLYKTFVTDISLPAGPFEMQVEKRGNTFIASFSHDTRTSAVIREKLIIPGGVFIPKVGWTETSFATGPGTVLKWLNIGKERRVKSTVTNNEMWGVGDASAGTKLPYGGNGINHPTSLGVAAVFQPVIQNSSFGGGVTVAETWQNMAGSRALATPITNNDGHPRQVVVTGSVAANCSFLVTIEGKAIFQGPPAYVATATVSTGVFEVLPGETYKVDPTDGVSTFNKWYERRKV